MSARVKAVRPRKHRAVRDNALIGNLFSHSRDNVRNWKAPETLPPLRGLYKKIGLDLETDGVGEKAMPVGFSIATPAEEGGYNRHYLPIRHRGGGNLDENVVRRYLQNEVCDLDIVLCESKFDLKKLRKFGVDLETQGCRPREVQFAAALLDDTRRSFKLDDLAQDVLGKKKVDIDRSLIWQLPAYEVGPYAEEDGALTLELDDVFQSEIVNQGLERVLNLENDLIWSTIHMEENGVPLDVPKMQRWHADIQKKYGAIVMEIADATGLRVNPDSGPDLAKLFKLLNLPYGFTDKGTPSFTDEFLATVEHDFVKKIRFARGINSLDSKFVGAYLKVVTAEGYLNYKLHQMKADDSHGGGMFGTISGRYSSSSKNIQQVFDKKRQIKKLGIIDYYIRELFIPRPGRIWVKADAKQIEYRLFAHYSNSKRIIERYRENPELDYHDEVREMLLEYVQIDRQDTKNVNFAKLYCAGVRKVSWMLNVSETAAKEVVDKYDLAIPEAKALAQTAIKIAEKRGYVHTLLGRRARFKQYETETDDGRKYMTVDRAHSALNRVIQGSAADVMKMKILEVYNNRKTIDLHMFYTVHDELDGDVDSTKQARMLKEMLDTQIAELNLRVPILWDVATGPNWANLKQLEKAA